MSQEKDPSLFPIISFGTYESTLDYIKFRHKGLGTSYFIEGIFEIEKFVREFNIIQFLRDDRLPDIHGKFRFTRVIIEIENEIFK
jgi:hypothetical protein